MVSVTLKKYKDDKLYPKVVKAVGLLLREKDEISTVDVLMKMGHVIPKDYEVWRKGNIAYLELVFQGSLSKAGRILRLIHFHMHDLNMIKRLKIPKGPGKRILRFSKSGYKAIEDAYSCRFKWNRSREKKTTIVEESISRRAF
ncbi:MAG: hypothetical protein JXD23_05840 [Spirochaetales bacterium]|nr:hypothetical protein [Spirochaetales bacterium]